MGRDPLEWDGGGRSGFRTDVVAKELLPAETAVALAAVRVEDPELRLPPRWTEPVAGDRHRRLLADDVPAEPDPRPSGELEAKAGRFGDRGRETVRQAGRLECDEERLRPAGERGETAETLRDAARLRAGIRPRRQVHDEQVHRPSGEERAGDRQALVERFGGEDDEPVETDAAGDGLDRIEGAGEVEPGDDRAVRLGLRGEPEGERRLARACVAPEGDAGAAGQAARAEDRVEGRETGPDDPVDRVAALRLRLRRQRCRRQRPDDPRSCRSPPRPEGRESSRHVRGDRRHQTRIIEQMF
jgi:hypothetical protein